MATFKQHRFSLVALCKDLAEQARVSLSLNAAPLYVEMDAVEEIDDLPNADFMGLLGFAAEQTEKELRCSFGIAVGTWGDPDIVRLTTIVDLVFDRLQVGKSLPLYLQAGQNPTWVYVVGPTEVSPVDRNGGRGFQLIATTVLSSQQA